MRRLRFMIGSVFVLTASLAVGAESLQTPGEAVMSELKAAMAKPDAPAAVLLLRELGAIYRFPASPAEAKQLLAFAGEAARHADPVIAAAAVQALGETRASEAAKHLEPWLRTGKPKPELRPLVLAAIRASGKLQAQIVIDALLKLARTSNDFTIAGEAMLSLGRFGSAKKAMRVQVTDKLLDVCKSARRNRGRWRILRASGLRALQDVTGQRLNAVPMFLSWWKAAKPQKDPFTYKPG